MWPRLGLIIWWPKELHSAHAAVNASTESHIPGTTFELKRGYREPWHKLSQDEFVSLGSETSQMNPSTLLYLGLSLLVQMFPPTFSSTMGSVKQKYFIDHKMGIGKTVHSYTGLLKIYTPLEFRSICIGWIAA